MTRRIRSACITGLGLAVVAASMVVAVAVAARACARCMELEWLATTRGGMSLFAIAMAGLVAVVLAFSLIRAGAARLYVLIRRGGRPGDGPGGTSPPGSIE